jgi:hypothetical protein
MPHGAFRAPLGDAAIVLVGGVVAPDVPAPARDVMG